MKKKLPAGSLILLICTAVFIAGMFLPLESDAERAILCGAYYKPMILAGEWWRFLTAGFVHAGVLHLFANSMSLMMLAGGLEKAIGMKKFYGILLASVLGGSAFVFAADGNVVTMGLSGGLYGLMACYTYLLIRSGAFRSPVVRRSVLPMYAVNIMINLMPGVSVSGHIGGFVTGFLLSGILCVPKETSKKHYAAAAVLLAGVLGVMCFRNAEIPSDQIYPGSDLRVLGQEKKMGFENHAYRIAERLDDIYGTDGMMVLTLEEY